MTEQTAVSVSGLYKDFKLPHERANSIKERILHFRRRKKTYEVQHALKDINFEVKKGEFFGIVGRNGSGKSTLLKLIGGIYQPTTGTIKVNGTLTPFIELGIGFNPELTGKDNVFLNGAILGLTHKEVEQKYQEIVEFAELEKFMDQKLKNYSSGMQVRLAFSIAIQAHNDILLIDEVLAVGDAAFQNKSLRVFESMRKQKNKTVLFVTHDMEAVRRFCDRAIMIEDSEVVASGSVVEVVDKYIDANLQRVTDNTPFGTNDIKQAKGSKKVVIDSVGFERTSTDSYKIKLNLTANQSVKDIVPGVVVRNQAGIMVTANNTRWDGITLPALKAGESLEVEFSFEDVLENGQYLISVNIVDGSDMLTFIDWKNDVKSFSVNRPYLTGGTTFPKHSIEYNKK